MQLKNAAMRFEIPVQDKERAKKFYSDNLGLKPTHENPYSIQYRYGDSYFVLTESASAGQGQYSLLTWIVEDIDTTKSELEAKGVQFENYDLPFVKTVNGIATLDNDRVAWFKDSEGNLLALAEMG